MPPSPEPVPSNRVAVISLVAGIVAVVLDFMPVGTGGAVAGPVLGLLAVVLGIIGMRRRINRGVAIAGTAVGGAAIVLAVIFMIMVSKALSGLANIPVEYDATVANGTATVSVTSPLHVGTIGGEFTGQWSATEMAGFYDGTAIVIVTGKDSATQVVSCQILLNGVTVDSQSGAGTVTCRAGLPGL